MCIHHCYSLSLKIIVWMLLVLCILDELKPKPFLKFCIIPIYLYVVKYCYYYSYPFIKLLRKEAIDFWRFKYDLGQTRIIWTIHFLKALYLSSRKWTLECLNVNFRKIMEDSCLQLSTSTYLDVQLQCLIWLKTWVWLSIN